MFNGWRARKGVRRPPAWRKKRVVPLKEESNLYAICRKRGPILLKCGTRRKRKSSPLLGQEERKQKVIKRKEEGCCLGKKQLRRRKRFLLPGPDKTESALPPRGEQGGMPVLPRQSGERSPTIRCLRRERTFSPGLHYERKRDLSDSRGKGVKKKSGIIGSKWRKKEAIHFRQREMR